MKPPIRVLVVEDSPSCRALLVSLLASDPRLEVVGIAADGEAAIVAAERLRPDVITMDVQLPRLDGYAATRTIMESFPTRIVIVTSTAAPGDVAASFRALEAGALAVLGKPPGPGHPGFAAAREELLRTVVLMAEVRVVRRRPSAVRARADHALTAAASGSREIALVAMGASTGGPLALQEILSGLAPRVSVPIVIVQHISPGFAEGFAQWLAASSRYAVRVAAQGERLQPGLAYVAPDGAQTTVRADGTVKLADEPPRYGFRPSVGILFRSVAEQFGRRAAGVLLTGMGHDGARELKQLRDAGGLTLAQDAASCAVAGMPGEAVRLGAAIHVMPPTRIAVALRHLLEREAS